MNSRNIQVGKREAWSRPSGDPLGHRPAGGIMPIALGAVYASSVFGIPRTRAFGWTISQVTLAFTIAILTPF